MPKRFVHKLTVRYKDVDAMNHVNNANYFTYIEEARMLFLRQLRGFQRLEELDFILLEQQMRYHKELLYGDEVDVEIRVTHIGKTSFTLEYDLRRRGELVAQARTVMVLYDYAGKTKRPVEPDFRAKLEGYMA